MEHENVMYEIRLLGYTHEKYEINSIFNFEFHIFDHMLSPRTANAKAHSRSRRPQCLSQREQKRILICVRNDFNMVYISTKFNWISWWLTFLCCWCRLGLCTDRTHYADSSIIDDAYNWILNRVKNCTKFKMSLRSCVLMATPSNIKCMIEWMWACTVYSVYCIVQYYIYSSTIQSTVI